MTVAEHLTIHPSAALRVALPAADMVNVVFHRIHRSLLNPRKRFDPDQLVELAVNIFERTEFDEHGNVTRSGIEQNLLGRPHPEYKGDVEIAAGERRYRAVAMLVDGLTAQVKVGEDENGRPIMGEKFYQVPDTYPLSFRLRDLTDAELIEAATVENVMRQDMTPMEEADAFMALIGAGRSVDHIAVQYGMHVNTVKSRVQLAAGLGREARKLLDEGKISLEQAKLIAATSGALKKSLTEQAQRGSSVYSMKHLVRAGAFLVDNAVFDVKASRLTIDEGGLIGDFPPRFADHKAALNQQLEALEQTRANEEATGHWGKVEVVPVDSEYANLSGRDWVTTPRGMKPHLLLICSTSTGKTSRSELYVRATEAQAFKQQQADALKAQQEAERAQAAEEGRTWTPDGTSGSPAPAETGPKIREAAHIIAHQARAQAIQGHLAAHPATCLALACEALVKSSIYRSGGRSMDLSLPTPKDVPLTEEARALAQELAATFGTVLMQGEDGRLTYRNFGFDVLEALSVPEVQVNDLLKLFAYLTHPQAGNWEHHQNGVPSRVKTLAERLEVTEDVQQRFTLSAEYLNGYTTDGLGALIETMPEKLRPVGLLKASKKQLVGLIMEKAPALKEAGWLPDLVKF